jgi:DmsE family decaheme c-type cytochrome
MRRDVFLIRALLVIAVAWNLPTALVAQTLDLSAISCMDCHGTQVHDFLKSRHGAALVSEGKTTEAALCGACHGEVDAHAAASRPREVPVQYRYKDPKACQTSQLQATCLSCHAGGTRAIPQDGHHWLNGASCLTCHTGMAKGGLPRLLNKPEGELCGACHPQALAPVRTGHRTDRTGALCTFCHDPHARTRPLLARDCTECHKAYAYPKPFEHPPVVQGCLGCHDPHGSMERFLLKDSRPALCLGCHSQLESFHRVDVGSSPFRLYEACQNCHPRVHGSDAHGGYRYQR